MTDSSNTGLVERVRAFVNTYEVHEDVDRLATPDSLAEWLEEMHLLDDDEVRSAGHARAATKTELSLAHELRSTIHALLGRDSSPGSERRRDIDRLSAQLPLRVELCSDGQPYLVPAVSGVRHGLARILAATAALSPDDWSRLKVCPADDCRWVFYDSSRNRSKRWCSMEGCGNRQKVRAYRDRH